MTRETEAIAAGVRAELRALRDHVRQLHGGMVASADGMVIAHDLPDIEPDGLAALTAAAIGVATRLTDATGQGGFEESLTRGSRGYVAAYAAGNRAVLTAVAGPDTNVGRLHLQARRTAARIAALLDAPAAPAAPHR
ncbi:roadblock/LC7 domain-containing protein [Streptomyces sp. RS10V-4]|uniref:roadblock/LC7 domain-containing protein n=1 Tax=Streptomyces rhizoryzae TaxID=2932493 RepID=UPI00200343AE|nr:roadblock/LC7 domain-containing protein [Streptomyces rhizoryzae]MCK7626341.1 roadblock/LC7 domain-containing protein [Streptomyces rhizoryzae]